VEDEESLRAVTREFLSNKGYRVFVAEDFNKAVEISDSTELHVHLLMTDVVLPGASGPKLADRLAQNRPDMKVLIRFRIYGRCTRSRRLAPNRLCLPLQAILAEHPGAQNKVHPGFIASS
jgi:CheY-like chemotaxis protein